VWLCVCVCVCVCVCNDNKVWKECLKWPDSEEDLKQKVQNARDRERIEREREREENAYVFNGCR